MEFKSPKIDEYIENLKIMEPDSALAKAQHDPGICPHCGEVRSVFYIFVQVNLCQKLLFLHQLTHNITTDCSLNLQIQYMKIASSEHVMYWDPLCT